MNEDIMRQAGFGDTVDKKEKGICPYSDKPIQIADFKDLLSLKEYAISGMCQKCQDEFFKPEK